MKFSIDKRKENIQKYFISLDLLTNEEYIEILKYMAENSGKVDIMKGIIYKGHYSNDILILASSKNRVKLMQLFNDIDININNEKLISNIFEFKNEQKIISQLDININSLLEKNKLFIIKLCSKFGHFNVYEKYKYDFTDIELSEVIDIGIKHSQFKFVYNKFSEFEHYCKAMCKNENTYYEFVNRYEPRWHDAYIKYAIEFDRNDILKFIYSRDVTITDEFINKTKKLKLDELLSLLKNANLSNLIKY